MIVGNFSSYGLRIMSIGRWKNGRFSASSSICSLPESTFRKYSAGLYEMGQLNPRLKGKHSIYHSSRVSLVTHAIYLLKYVNASSTFPWNTQRPEYISIICVNNWKISDVGWWIEHITAFGVLFTSSCDTISISLKAISESLSWKFCDCDKFSSRRTISCSVSNLSDLITVRAL